MDARRTPQKNAALELSIAAGVEVLENGCGREEITKYQDYLAREENTAIIIYACSKDNKQPVKFYDGIKRVEELQHVLKYVVYIAFYIDFNHYEPIKCIYRFINKNNRAWCMLCQKGLQREHTHRCVGNCSRCFKMPPCQVEVLKKCMDCRLSFANNNCYDYHKVNTSYHGRQSVCSARRLCQTCHCLTLVDKKHYCGKNWCSICGKYREAGVVS